jgi:LDH2 family malate/lactate/ureidoglycolate dehydrogenase
MMAINIESFRPLDEFKAEVDRQVRTIRASKPMPGFDRVYLPGEPEWLKKEEQLREGIALPAGVLPSLEALGHELGITLGWKA